MENKEKKKTREEFLEEVILFMFLGMLEVNSKLCDKAAAGEIDNTIPIPIMTVMANLIETDVVKEFFDTTKNKCAKEMHKTLEIVAMTAKFYRQKAETASKEN